MTAPTETREDTRTRSDALSWPSTVAAVLDEWREEQGLSESEMSRRCGFSPGWWRRRANGQTMNLYEFFLACRAVGAMPAHIILSADRRASS